MNIAVLFGGISPERNVSLKGGKAVVNALKSLGYNVKPVDPALGANCLVDIDNIEIPGRTPTDEELLQYPTSNLIKAIDSEVFNDVELAFLVLHGINGEDGKMQALLELRGIPYTGSDVKASSLAIDKSSSKMVFHASGILTAPWIIARRSDLDNFEFLEEIRSEIGGRVVFKPNDQGSSIGVNIIDSGNLDEMHEALKDTLQYSNTAIIEPFIGGQEITVGIIGGESLPIVEIIPGEGFYDYEHKYTKGQSEYICPAELTPDIDEFTRGIAETAFAELGCSGFARADFRLNDEGQPFIMEMNTIPGFTETSLVPMAAKELDIDFPELCQRIIDLAIEKNQ
jgi:D-alanine-D-alanine ligase